MSKVEFSIEIERSSGLAFNIEKEVQSLRNDIVEVDNSVKVERVRKLIGAEEAGGDLTSILQISLNSAAMVALIKVVHSWIQYKLAVQKRPFKFTFKSEGREFSVDTEKDIDLKEFLKAIQDLMKDKGL